MSSAQPLKKQEEPTSVDFTTIGVTGLKQQSGVIDEEWHHRLKHQRNKIWREMSDNDPVIGGLLFAIEHLMRNVEFSARASGETERHHEEAKFLESALNDMSMTWEDLLSEILTMVVFGWSYFEVVYKLRQGRGQKDPSKRSNHTDGRIGWRKISIRAQETLERWKIDEGGGIKGMWQRPPSGSRVFIPIEKALLFRTKSSKNNPEGRSLLRNSFRSWRFKKRLEELQVIGMERDLAGLPVIKVPKQIMSPSASSADKMLREHFELLVQQIRRDEREGLVFPHEIDPQSGDPTGYSVELIAAPGKRQIDILPVIDYYDKRILLSVLAQFMLLGQHTVGSYSLASSQTALFSFALNSILDSIVSVFNRFAIPQLFTLNGVPQEFWPSLVHGDIEKPSLQELANYVSALVNTGAITPDSMLEEKLRSVGDLPTLKNQDLPVDPTEDPPSPPEMPSVEVDENGEEEDTEVISP